MEDLRTATLEELQKLLPTTTGQREAEVLNAIASKNLNVNKHESMAYATRALNKSKETGYSFGEAKASNTLGVQHDNLREGITLIKNAYNIFTALNEKEELSTTLRSLVITYHKLGDLDIALTYAEELVALCEHNNIIRKIGGAYSIYATILIVRGEYGKALPVMHRALAILEKAGIPGEIAMACSNLTALYFNLDNLEKALEYALKSNAEYKAAKLELLDAETLLIIGQCYAKMNKTDEALKYVLESLKLAEELNHNRLEAEVFPTLGSLYLVKQEYNKAYLNLHRGYELCNKQQQLQPAINALFSLGNLFKTKAYSGYNVEVAEKHLLEALSLSKANGLKWEVREISLALSALYEEQQNWEEAYKCHKEYSTTDKELSNSESRNKMESFEVEKQLAITVKEKEVTDKILYNILPQKIAERIRTGDEEIIERYENATVLFADIVGFTEWSRNMPVKELTLHLNRFFQLFDELAIEHRVEKIKTIGDAYMCVAGLPEPCDDHVERIANMAIAMNKKIREAYPNGEIRLRTGIHTGEVIAGVLGKNKYAYDLWGDTVNTAARMESYSQPDRIQVTEEIYEVLQGRYDFEHRGEIEVKGKGKMNVYFLNG
jgi:adenylate cyclase